MIWSLGLIALLGLAVMVGARYRSKTTASLVSTGLAAAAAESAINLAIVQAIAPTGQGSAFPLRCRMPGGERVVVSIEEEVGKVDLNTATPAILARLFGALTPDQLRVNRIVERIVAFRDPTSGRAADARPANQRPVAGTSRGFVTILQLDQIEGVSPGLLRAVLPFLTVSSGQPEPDAAAALPALRELLNLEDTPARPVLGGLVGGPRSVTIRADVEATGGIRFIRIALVLFGPANGKPYLIREWRRGDMRFASHGPGTPDDAESPAKNCIQFGARADASS